MNTEAPIQFPHPIPSTLRASQCEIFNGYGSLGAVDVRMTDTVAQKSRSNDARHRLYTSRPSLPLFPPHYVREPYSDPCMGDLERRRQRTLSALSTLSHIKSLVNKDTEQQRNLRARLSKLERCPASDKGNNVPGTTADVSKPREDENDQPSIYPVLPVLAEILREQIGNDTDLHKVNSRYSGGCLSSLSRETPGGQESVLAYASDGNLCTLSLPQSLWDGCEFGEHENCVNKVKVDEKIYQVVTAQVGAECYCAIRQERKCNIFRMGLQEDNEMENDTATTKLQPLHAWPHTQIIPTSICISPYLAGECAVAADNGSVYLWTQDGRFDEVCTTKPRFSGVENWFSCHFGAHPREIIVSDRTGISLFDVRQPTLSVGMDVFILPHKLLNHSERVMLSCQHARNPFCHVIATDRNLVLVDERFPSSPVLHWSHTLRSPPQYIDIVSGLTLAPSGDHDSDVILLASQHSHETHCFQFALGQGSQGSRPPRATTSPWTVSQAEDFLHLSRPDCVLPADSLLSRLSVSLVGMSAVTRPAADGFTVLQMTAHGDIFHQTYKFDDDASPGLDTTYSAGPGSHNLSLDVIGQNIATRWLQEEEKSVESLDSGNEWPLQKCEVSHSYQGMGNQAYPHVLCSLCMPQLSGATSALAANIAASESEMCHTCGNSLAAGAQFRQAVCTKGIARTDDVTLEIDTCLSTFDPSRFNDTTSQCLTKLWQEDYDIYDLLKKKDEEQVALSQKTTQVATEATDDALNISDNISSEHSDNDMLSLGHQVDEIPSSSTSIDADVSSPSISASDRPAPSQNMMSPTNIPRRRHSSVSSVDSVAAGRSQGKPGFGSTPPKRHRSQLSATFVPRKSITFASHVSTSNDSSRHPSQQYQHVPTPNSKIQKWVSVIPSGPDVGISSGSPSFSQDHVMGPPGASNAARTKSSGSTPTGKTKRRQFVIGF